jgi:hypothetical protein
MPFIPSFSEFITGEFRNRLGSPFCTFPFYGCGVVNEVKRVSRGLAHVLSEC